MMDLTQPQIEAGMRAWGEVPLTGADRHGRSVTAIYTAMRALDPEYARLSAEREEAVDLLGNMIALIEAADVLANREEYRQVCEARALLARISKGAEG
jgi:hypothetical protein